MSHFKTLFGRKCVPKSDGLKSGVSFPTTPHPKTLASPHAAVDACLSGTLGLRM